MLRESKNGRLYLQFHKIRLLGPLPCGVSTAADAAGNFREIVLRGVFVHYGEFGRYILFLGRNCCSALSVHKHHRKPGMDHSWPGGIALNHKILRVYV